MFVWLLTLCSIFLYFFYYFLVSDTFTSRFLIYLLLSIFPYINSVYTFFFHLEIYSFINFSKHLHICIYDTNFPYLLLQDSMLLESVILSVNSPEIEGITSGTSNAGDDIQDDATNALPIDALVTKPPRRSDTPQGTTSGDDNLPTTLKERKHKRVLSSQPNELQDSLFWDQIKNVLSINQAEQDFAYGVGVMLVNKLRQPSQKKQEKFAMKALMLMNEIDSEN